MRRTVDDTELPKGAGTAGEVPPLPSASVILIRRTPIEVLMMRRNERSSFVPGAWVFPGGTVDEADMRSGEDDEMSARRCAVREVFEETGIWLGTGFADQAGVRQKLLAGNAVDLDAHLGDALESLVLTSRWVTPVGVPKRFDTWFFVSILEGDVEGTPDDAEGVELAWVRPGDALQRHRQESFPMVFPTIRNLEEIASFERGEDLLAARRGVTVRVRRPVLVVENGQKRIVLPEEP